MNFLGIAVGIALLGAAVCTGVITRDVWRALKKRRVR